MSLAIFKNPYLPPANPNKTFSKFACTHTKCNNDDVHCSLTTEY